MHQWAALARRRKRAHAPQKMKTILRSRSFRPLASTLTRALFAQGNTLHPTLHQTADDFSPASGGVVPQVRWWNPVSAGTNFRIRLFLLGLVWFVGQLGQLPLVAQQTGGLPALEERMATLEATVAALQGINTNQAAEIAALKARVTQVEVKTTPISVAGTNFVITGKNVFIVDGSGGTDSGSGLGNLTVGYNALRAVGGNLRSGTHNLILGDRHNYTSYGGLVAGDSNEISRPFATVAGGFANRASGYGATVSGGEFNTASGVQSSILGGKFNTASGDNSSVSGGNHNVAQADDSSVSGGLGRVAPFLYNWAAGGLLFDH